MSWCNLGTNNYDNESNGSFRYFWIAEHERNDTQKIGHMLDLEYRKTTDMWTKKSRNLGRDTCSPQWRK